jgi:hypothetical protein
MSQCNPCHCEERSDEAIQTNIRFTGLLRYARNDSIEHEVFSVELTLLWGWAKAAVIAAHDSGIVRSHAPQIASSCFVFHSF